MNYRHAFHAGNFADVVKHAVLVLLVQSLKRKDTPFCVIDTHAGIGRYDLSGVQAQKTGEFRQGVTKLLEADASSLPAGIKPYLSLVRAMNKGVPALRWYPGSPRLSLDLLRPQDRLVLLELHPEDAKTLASLFAGDKRAKVHNLDGYTALKAFLPPKERRGLVLIDPPFEKTNEFEQVVRGLRQAYRRWAGGHYLVWYPIKGRGPVEAFYDDLRASGIPQILVAEFLLRKSGDPDRLNGCGLVLVNPPWQLDTELDALLPALAKILTSERGGGASLTWLQSKDAASASA